MSNNALNKLKNGLKDHKESAGLLLTLGRLYKEQKLWGKAKSLLESSLSRRPLVATYAELAEMHEQLNETVDAQRCAKKGLHIATRDIVEAKRNFLNKSCPPKVMPHPSSWAVASSANI